MTLSIRAKLTLLYIATMSLLIVAFFFFVYITFSHAIFSSDVSQRFDSRLIEFGKRICWEISRQHGPFYLSIERYRDYFNSRIYDDFFLNESYGQMRDYPPQYTRYPILLIRNNALGDRYLPLSREAYEDIKKKGRSIETLKGVCDFPVRVVSYKIRDLENQEYILQIGVSLKPVTTTFRNVLFRFILFGPLVLLVIAVIGYLFVKKSFSPVRDIVRLTRQITAEDLSLRIKQVPGGDAVSELADTLNDMIARLESSFRHVRQFSDDVSHELRTPLTVVKGQVEVALRHSRTPEEYMNVLKSLLEEVNKLEGIMDNLLFLTRIDARRIEHTFEDVELEKVLLESYEEVYPMARGKNITFEVSRLDEALVRGNAGLLKRLVVNLMVNAVKFTPEKGVVSVDLAVRTGPGDDADTAVLSVRDTGIGIPAEAIPRIFDRFYRVDRSRSPRSGGSGLGLTIVKRIADLHGATIRVESEVQKGTVFLLLITKINNH